MQEPAKNNSLEAKLEQEKTRLGSHVYEQARRIVEHGDLIEQTLVKRLLEGTITSERFEKVLEALKGETAQDEQTQNLAKELARQEIAAEIAAETFDKAMIIVEKGNLDRVQWVRNLVHGKVKERKFLQEIKTFSELFGKEEVNVRREGVRSYLKAYSSSFEQYKETKIDTPADLETFRNSVEKFKEGTQKMDVVGDRLKNIFQTAAKGDGKLAEIIEEKTMSLRDHAIRADEEAITKIKIKKELGECGIKGTEVDEIAAKIEKEFAEMQKIDHEMFADNTHMKGMLQEREKEMMKRSMTDMEISQAEKSIGISLKAGTKIRFRQFKANEEKQTIEQYEDSAEILGVYVDPSVETEKIEWQGREHEPIGLPIVVVTGQGAFTLGRLKKWVENAEAYEDIKNVQELNTKIGFEKIHQPLREGLELQWNEYRRDKAIDKKGEKAGERREESQTVKISRLGKNTIELDREVVVMASESAPEKKQKLFTFGQFAQWVISREVLPNIKTQKELDAAMGKKVEPGSIFVPDTPRGHYYCEDAYIVKTSVNENGGDEDGTLTVNKKPMSAVNFLRSAQKKNLHAHDAHEDAKEMVAPLEGTEMHGEELKKEEERLKKMAEKAVEREQKEHDGGGEHGDGAHSDAAHSDSGHSDDKHKGPKMETMYDVSVPTTNYFKDTWNKTTSLSVKEVWELLKACYDYYKRWYERHSKRRYAVYGKDLPYVGNEMKRIKEDSEHQEVGKFKEGMTSMGIIEIREILHETKNVDQVKACIETLVEKGQMRWDDINFWKSLNRHVPPHKQIRYDTSAINPDPWKRVYQDPKTGKWLTGLDMIKGATDFLWGDNQYNNWESSNESKYNSQTETYFQEGDKLENDPKGLGGPGAELQRMLQDYFEGRWADPHRYEGLIRFIIDKGKSAVEKKIYYIVLGAASGLLSLDRIGAIDGKYLNQFPILDYLTDKSTQKFCQDPGEGHAYKPHELKAFARHLMEDPTAKQYEPGLRTKEIIWEKMLRHKAVRFRNNKGLRSGEKIDHDDTMFILPLASQDIVIKALGSAGGGKNFFTLEGYLNAYSGYSEWIKKNAKMGDMENVVEALKAYVAYDGILDKRYKVVPFENVLMRASESDFRKPAVMDNHPVNAHRDQIKNMILQIGQAYGVNFSTIFEKVETTHTPEGEKKAKEIQTEIDYFGGRLDKSIGTDGGAKLMQIVAGTKLLGTGEKMMTEEEIRKRKTQAEAAQEARGEEVPKAKGGH